MPEIGKSVATRFIPSIRSLVIGAFVLSLQVAYPHQAGAQSQQAPAQQNFTSSNSAAAFYGNEFETSVADKPFSAIEERVTSFRTADSKLQNRSLTVTEIHRDSQGRVRADRKTTTFDGHGVATERFSAYIADPVAHTILILDPERHTAIEMPWEEANAAEARKVQPSSASAQYTQIQVKTESLGERSMEGMQVDGSMRELTIPIRAELYSRAVAVSIETWVSRELSAPVWSRSETSSGEISTTMLKDVDRSEPNAHLFELPSNYKLTSPGADSVFAMSR